MLYLDVNGFADAASWTWRLTDDVGLLLAEHDVSLDPASTEFSLLTDLYGNRWRLDEGPVRQRRSELRQIEHIGSYVTVEVLGAAVRVIADRAPAAVQVNLPPEAAGLLAMPLELARYQGESLADRGVVFCYRPRPEPRSAGQSHAGPLRVLAVFALPGTSSALGLVRERRALEDVILEPATVGGSSAPRLEILQYGATRESLAEALADPAGWDIIHLAGHGGPGRLYLEDEDGNSVPIEAAELIRLLGRGRVKLVVLSACESGVARAARILGVPPALSADRAPVMLPALGFEIASTLGCVVVAMRYPVDDRFSSEFVRFWYQAILADGLPVGDAMRTARLAAAAAVPAAPLSVATPILLADDAGRRLLMPPGPAAPAATRRRRQPSAPELFVGRTRLLARLGAALDPASQQCGIVVTGMPGVGKTATCAEAAARYASRFDRVIWHRATRRETARTLAATIDRRQVRDNSTLVIIDSAGLLLAEDGTWADPGIAELITALVQPGATSRVMLVTDRPLPGLGALTATFVVPMLSRSESEWLARELAELRSGGEDGAEYAHLTWLVGRGHPGLTDYCGTPDKALTERRLRRLWYAWEVFGPLSPVAARAQRALGRDHPGRRLGDWALSRAGELSDQGRRALVLLSVLEQADRDRHWVEFIWKAQAELRDADAGSLSAAITELVASGLAEESGRGYLLHPAIASAGRGLDADLAEISATAMVVGWRHEYQRARTGTGDQGVLAYCAASTVPYLMRLSRWEDASAACELAINHESSPAMAARLATYAVEIVEASAGTPLEPKARFVHAVLASDLLRGKGIEHFTYLLAWARESGALDVVVSAAHSLAVSLASTDPVQAGRVLQVATDANSGDPFGPWLGIRLAATRAGILSELGGRKEALELAGQALAELDQLEQDSVEPRGVNPVGLRRDILLTAAQAARRLNRPDLAATYEKGQARLLATAAQRSLAQAQFNEVHQLIAGGELQTAGQLLRAALATFTGSGNARERGLVLINLAQVEHRLGHPREAAAFGRQALRASYAAGETLDAASAHTRMSNFLAAGPSRMAGEAPVHVLATAVIQSRVNGKLLAAGFQPEPLTAALTRLAMCQARQPELILSSFSDLASKLAGTTGTDLTGLLGGLERVPVQPGPEPGTLQFILNSPAGDAGDSVTDVLCWVQQVAPPGWVADPGNWQPVIDAAVAAATTARAGQDARPVFDQFADDLRGAGWGTLGDALTRLIDDRGGFAMPDGLEPVERAVIERAAGLLAGRQAPRTSP